MGRDCGYLRAVRSKGRDEGFRGGGRWGWCGRLGWGLYRCGCDGAKMDIFLCYILYTRSKPLLTSDYVALYSTLLYSTLP